MKIGATTAIVVAALLAAGCGGSMNSAAPAASTQASTPAPATTAPSTPAATTPAPRAGPTGTCLAVPASFVRTLQNHLVLKGGRLSHLQAVTTKTFPDLYFISARVDGGGTKALLATWATRQLAGGGPVYAVDVSAALISVYGAAAGKNPSLTVEAPGVYKSRVCVAGPNAPRGSTAPVGTGGGAPFKK